MSEYVYFQEFKFLYTDINSEIRSKKLDLRYIVLF